MSQSINKSSGFTLIELLVAITILAGISVTSVKLLYDTVNIRSKQYSIEYSTDSVRLVVSTLSSLIQSAQVVEVINPQTIKITGLTEAGVTPCRLFSFDNTDYTIKQIADDADCSSGATTMTPEEVVIDMTQSSFSPTGPNPTAVTITIGGIYKDNLGEHPFSYATTAVNRIAI